MAKRIFNAGHLDRYIDIEAESATRNEYNELENSWSVVKTCKAAKLDIELKRNNEDVDERIVTNKGRTEWTIRYDVTLFPMTTKRIKEIRTGELYDIEEVRGFGKRQQFLKIISNRVQQR